MLLAQLKSLSGIVELTMGLPFLYLPGLRLFRRIAQAETFF